MIDLIIQRYLEPSWPFIVAYSVAFLMAYSAIQSVKMARRECKRPKYPHFFIRFLAGLCAGLSTFAILAKFYDVEFTKAALHGCIASVLYPLFMTVLMALLKVHYPKIYNRIRIPRRRDSDINGDPDDTQELFF